MSPAVLPTLTLETELARRSGRERCLVVGLDEVGRGALAGPLTIGACAVEVVAGEEPALPEGVRDSKALSAARRERLVDPIREAAAATALGWASAGEIDQHGISQALRLAAVRAVTALDVPPDVILLDGSVDLLAGETLRADGIPVPVFLQVKADRDCASVAAASILAKVARDHRMIELDAQCPQYGWAGNKGYGSAAHREAIDQLGPGEHHRLSWRLGSGARGGSAGVLWEDQMPRQREEERR